MTKRKLKEKADKVFSLYIRQRDADDNGMISCITCKRTMHWKKCHAGHFISRSCLTTRYEETNVHAQCPKCNLWDKGQQYIHSLEIDKKYGKGKADELYRQSKQTTNWNEGDYEDLIEKFQTKTKEIQANRGW